MGLPPETFTTDTYWWKMMMLDRRDEREARQSEQIRANMVKMHDDTVALVGGRPFDETRSPGRAMFECVRHIVDDFNRKNEDVPTIFCPHNGQTSGCFGFGCELQLCESCEKTWVEYIHSREWR